MRYFHIFLEDCVGFYQNFELVFVEEFPATLESRVTPGFSGVEVKAIFRFVFYFVQFFYKQNLVV